MNSETLHPEESPKKWDHTAQIDLAGADNIVADLYNMVMARKARERKARHGR